jgi:hypothetical protein
MSFGERRGERPSGQKLEGDLLLAAASTCPVLITADSAEHRGRIAELVHRTGYFERIDCANIDELPLGARTVLNRTLFLDNIDRLESRFQTELFEFLEEPVRSVRLIAGTNVSLVDRVRAGQFRADLLYRLNVIHVIGCA